MRVQVTSFAAMALIPLGLCLLAAAWGGVWVWLAVGYLGLVVAGLDLVLPAFGCGVHGNDPSMVAEVFRGMLTDPGAFGGLCLAETAKRDFDP